MKKILSLIFLTCMPFIGNAFTGIVEIDGIYYNVITKAKTAEVTTISQDYYGEIGYYSGDIVIPSFIEYEGVICNVTSIQREAFFNCKNLLSINLPSSIVSIGVLSFSGCSQLSSIKIPNSVTSVEAWAFKDCINLVKIEFGNELTSIGIGAFENCISLTSVVIPSLVTIIDAELFKGCNSIKSIQFGTNIEQINPRAFMDCSSLTEISSITNATYIGSEAFLGCSSLSSIEIGNSIKSIYEGTFQKCSSLKTFVIPDGISSIGKNGFCDCSNLISVYLPKSITSIGEFAFRNCPEISDVYCYPINPPKTETLPFLSSYPEYATLHVPENSLQLYKDNYSWNSFGNIVPINEDLKCATPTIFLDGDKLSFTCKTDGVTFHYSISHSDVKNGTATNDVNLTQTYTISVYATKDGYNNSEVAKATLKASGSVLLGDVNGDGIVNVADHVKLTDIIMNK